MILKALSDLFSLHFGSTRVFSSIVRVGFSHFTLLVSSVRYWWTWVRTLNWIRSLIFNQWLLNNTHFPLETFGFRSVLGGADFCRIRNDPDWNIKAGHRFWSLDVEAWNGNSHSPESRGDSESSVTCEIFEFTFFSKTCDLWIGSNARPVWPFFAVQENMTRHCTAKRIQVREHHKTKTKVMEGDGKIRMSGLFSRS